MNRIVPLLLLFLSKPIQANKHGVYCTQNSDCDQKQLCSDNKCSCDTKDGFFWSGTQCLVCDKTYTVSKERCYQMSSTVTTWAEARAHCRTKSADLFTWRHNDDEAFIRPILKRKMTDILGSTMILNIPSLFYYRYFWSSATITSFQPHRTEWADPDGLALNSKSRQWCTGTTHSGYNSENKPSQNTKIVANETYREECVAYHVDSSQNYFCLANDYCNQRYFFVCEINDFSIRLASSSQNGGQVIVTSSRTTESSSQSTQIPTQTSTTTQHGETESDKDEVEVLSAIREKEGTVSKANLVIFGGVGLLLVVGAVAGYMVIQKKKKDIGADGYGAGEDSRGPSQGRPSFTSSVGSTLDG